VSSLPSTRQILQWNGGASTVAVRRHSSAPPKQDDKSNQASDHEGEKERLKDTVRRMSGGAGDGNTSMDPRLSDFLRTATSTWTSFSTEVGKAWDELLRSGERKDINKKLIHPKDTEDGDKEYTGPVAIMVIDESENLSAWQRMQKRLADAPIIQGKFFTERFSDACYSISELLTAQSPLTDS
jgi:hypothetical protein